MKVNATIKLPWRMPKSKDFIAALILIILLVGCAQKQQEVHPGIQLSETLQIPSLEITGFTDQSIMEGEFFSSIELTDILSTTIFTPDQISWEVVGGGDFTVFIFQGHELRIIPPDREWSGIEKVKLLACNPEGLCDSKEASFSVQEVNDPPSVNVADQIIQLSSKFSPLNLASLSADMDHPAEDLTWTVSGAKDLMVEMENGLVNISSPGNGWTGREQLFFQVCDPLGECRVDDALFAVLGESDIYLIHVGVSGFLIISGDKKILIDSLFIGTEYTTAAGQFKFYVPNEVQEKIEKGISPFNDIDIAIITHVHPDHYDSGTAESFLENNPKTILVANSAVQLIESHPDWEDRIILIDLDYGESEQLTVAGVDLEAFHMPHNLPDLGFIITLGETKLFHPGDLDVELIGTEYIQELGIPEKDIDIAFAPIYSIHESRNHREIFGSFDADYLILMHYPFPYDDANYALIDEYFPDAKKMKVPLGTWLMPEK